MDKSTIYIYIYNQFYFLLIKYIAKKQTEIINPLPQSIAIKNSGINEIPIREKRRYFYRYFYQAIKELIRGIKLCKCKTLLCFH